MKISLVVAAAENNGIGKDNKLPWHLPNDLKFFKNTTWGMPVLMGRKTFESLGKPLNGRINMVLTRQNGWKAEGAITVHSVSDAKLFCEANDYKELFIIGGAEIFDQTIDKADKLYLTRVHATPEVDVYFPIFDQRAWQLRNSKEYAADEKHAYPYTFQLWERQ